MLGEWPYKEVDANIKKLDDTFLNLLGKITAMKCCGNTCVMERLRMSLFISSFISTMWQWV